MESVGERGLPVILAVSSRRERHDFTFSVYFTGAEFCDPCKLQGFIDVVFTVSRRKRDFLDPIVRSSRRERRF